MKVDSGLCQPAGTPILGQTGRRLRVTFAIVDVVADVFRPVHVSVERGVTLLTDVQAAFDTLTIVFSTADATHLTRVAFGDCYDFNTLDLCLVFEDFRESVERPSVQVKVSVFPPVFRLSVLVFADTSKFPDSDSTHPLFDTPFNDVFR